MLLNPKWRRCSRVGFYVKFGIFLLFFTLSMPHCRTSKSLKIFCNASSFHLCLSAKDMRWKIEDFWNFNFKWISWISWHWFLECKPILINMKFFTRLIFLNRIAWCEFRINDSSHEVKVVYLFPDLFPYEFSIIFHIRSQPTPAPPILRLSYAWNI